MLNSVCVFLGGGLGAITRVYCVKFFTPITLGVHLGVLSVNVIGSLCVGFFIALSSSLSISNSVKYFLLSGFLAAFTTFSTYSMETLKLIQVGNIGAALGTILLHNSLGIGAVFLGWYLLRFLIS